MSRRLHLTKFKELNIEDPFFDSLKKGYDGFPNWFASKLEEDVYAVIDTSHVLSGMVYLKDETGSVDDTDPPLPALKWLKVGTLKIEGRGTRLGERVIKKIFDTAISRKREGVYVTVFELHATLIKLFERYGFKKVATKTTTDGTELVLARIFSDVSGNSLLDYPFLHTKNKRYWLLAVYPEYHSRLLPDSILNNEPEDIVRDVSYTNTIHKVYIGRTSLMSMSPGDLVVIYRTSDNRGPAYFRSVATSVCVVEEVRSKKDFPSIDEFLEYTKPRSVFGEEELRSQYLSNKRLYVAKMTYNVAFHRRTTRGVLMDEAGISEQPRWNFRELSNTQFQKILELGKVDARLIVN
ncbi:N-acetyltransferase [Acetobacter sp. DmW_136]|uniref:N-acetyltransferase n=1 Tax=Acetobacter sp. DmW_136 TaxID=2591091 RepID=UPI00123C74F8|nr:N-acetyltransferase [Acetobacter sp. DmW_136]KAA8386501.1 N-acetyltransferase [Acetobacter sp. DmW_136]